MKLKMKMDPSLQAVGLQCGVDVEALYTKYARSGVGSKVSTAGKESTIGDTQNAPAGCEAAQSESGVNASCLDRMRICPRCHGYGLVKEHYNHQVKEVNCGECQGEGIIDSKQN